MGWIILNIQPFFMKPYMNYLISAISILLIFFGIKFNSSQNDSSNSIDSLTTIKLTFVGDLMCHTPQIEYAEINDNSLDFNPAFREVKPFLENSDLTFGNFETVVLGNSKRFSGYPNFNSPAEYLKAIKNSGFDVLFTSNNHSMDQGKDGVISTLEKIKSFGMMPIGTNSSPRERDSLRIINVKGIKLGLNSYSYGLNGRKLSSSNDFLVNIIDTIRIRQDILKLISKKIDVVIIYFHFGEEYSRSPSELQKEIVNKTFNYGADIIIASHPHVVQPVEFFCNPKARIKKGLIAYSLGNFFSNQQWRYSDAGLILNLEITKNKYKDSLWISKVSDIPTWVFKGDTKKGREYLIIPTDTSLARKIPDFDSEKHIQKIIEAYADTHSLFRIR
jgi:poly-gamma-glutamate capsule biosynthesis protein CapA/YwtB (metallophosphatase superfamily)